MYALNCVKGVLSQIPSNAQNKVTRPGSPPTVVGSRAAPRMPTCEYSAPPQHVTLPGRSDNCSLQAKAGYELGKCTQEWFLNFAILSERHSAVSQGYHICTHKREHFANSPWLLETLSGHRHGALNGQKIPKTMASHRTEFTCRIKHLFYGLGYITWPFNFPGL